MKRLLAIVLLIAATLTAEGRKSDFDRYFTGERLRIDLILAGNSQHQQAFLEELVYEPCWAGTRTQLIPSFDYGHYTTDVYTTDGKLIFRRGFNSLFEEWCTTEEAETINKAFTNSAWIPFPKVKVRVVVTGLDRHTGKRSEMLSFEVDPGDKLITRGSENSYKYSKILDNGPVENHVDLCIIAEGYTEAEMDKFRADAERLTGYLFLLEPFSSRKSDFNVWIVESVSEESGTDIPHEDIWRNTVAASNFYTFRIDRYLTAPDHRRIAQIASAVPHDALYVIVNHGKYGGGGIYNYYALSTADHPAVKAVFPHEFGHSFAGLADEYYTSEVAYQDAYPAGVEPWEPNITTQADFASKWKDMIEPGTPVPTPNDPKYKNVTGLFEGGGYSAKGVWRPYYECRMKNNTAPAFCPVCQRAINLMIDYYCR